MHIGLGHQLNGKPGSVHIGLGHQVSSKVTCQKLISATATDYETYGRILKQRAAPKAAV